MDIQDFVKTFRNHPIMFIGTGLSLRYLATSYSWEELLKKVASEFEPNEEYYLDIKSEYMTSDGCDYSKVATRIEEDFNRHLQANRNGKFKSVNDAFYSNMQKNIKISRFKLYIAELMGNTVFKDNVSAEIAELKKARKTLVQLLPQIMIK